MQYEMRPDQNGGFDERLRESMELARAKAPRSRYAFAVGRSEGPYCSRARTRELVTLRNRRRAEKSARRRAGEMLAVRRIVLKARRSVRGRRPKPTGADPGPERSARAPLIVHTVTTHRQAGAAESQHELGEPRLSVRRSANRGRSADQSGFGFRPLFVTKVNSVAPALSITRLLTLWFQPAVEFNLKMRFSMCKGLTFLCHTPRCFLRDRTR
jgi:hypothetical protein